MSHPVQLEFAPVARMQRVHVVVRLVLLAALASLGCSSIYGLLYLSFPALAAVLTLQKGGARYLSEDAPRIAKLLAWVAWIYAYAWLLTDSVPGPNSPNPVALGIGPQGTPSATSALSRLLYTLPALVVLVLLSVVAWVAWIVARGENIFLPRDGDRPPRWMW